MRCKWGIGRGIESGDADGAGKCISGISEMEAIARRLVLKLEILETLEGCFGCNDGGEADVFLSKRKGRDATGKVPAKKEVEIFITFA